MVHHLYGPYLAIAYKIFTFGFWNMNVAEKYIYSNCYKIITCDPKDTIVVEAGSLKVSVSQAIIKLETQRKLKRLS